MVGLNMERFEYIDCTDTIYDKLTGEHYHTWYEDDLLELLNSLNDRADKNAELCTDEGLIKLKWQVSIYKHFSEKTMEILEKYEIDSLEKLDRILFEQRVW